MQSYFCARLWQWLDQNIHPWLHWWYKLRHHSKFRLSRLHAERAWKLWQSCCDKAAYQEAHKADILIAEAYGAPTAELFDRAVEDMLDDCRPGDKWWTIRRTCIRIRLE